MSGGDGIFCPIRPDGMRRPAMSFVNAWPAFIGGLCGPARPGADIRGERRQGHRHAMAYPAPALASPGAVGRSLPSRGLSRSSSPRRLPPRTASFSRTAASTASPSADSLYRLEALTVRRAEATGRLPIALIAHGKPASPQGMLDDHAVNFTSVARDLASRGWLAVVVIRRGFGQSDGPMPVPVNCRTTSFIPRFRPTPTTSRRHFCGDLGAARRRCVACYRDRRVGRRRRRRRARRPQSAEPARGRQRLRWPADRKLSQGRCPRAGVPGARHQSRVPALWIYARNDSYFPPDIVSRMHEAFLGAGGDVKLVMFDAIGADGHAIFSTGAGRYRWLPEMDGFLRFHALPTWQRRDVDALLKRLDGLERNRSFVEGYLAAPYAKALARSRPTTACPAAGATARSERPARGLDGCGKQRPPSAAAS